MQSDARQAAFESPARLVSYPDADAKSEFRWRRWYALIPVALALIASANVLMNGFVADDRTQILQNEGIQSLANIPNAFVTSVWSYVKSDIIFSIDNYFRPLFNVYLTLGYQIFENSAWGWHLASILISAGAVFLVFLVVREIAEDNWVALLAAALFAVHPAHSESVAWISGVTDPLMALFALPSFYFYWRYKKTGHSRLFFFAVLLYLGALLTKETAVALPAVVIYCELFYFNGGVSATKRVIRATVMGAAFAAPTAVYLLLRWHALNGLVASTGTEYPAGPAMKTLPLALAKYLRLSVIPYGYSYQHYTPPVEAVLSARFVLPVTVVALVTGGIAAAKSRRLTLAAVWFMAWLAPALLAIRRFDSEYLVQDRYLYLPTIGACIAIALGTRWLADRLQSRVKEALLRQAIPLVLGFVLFGALAQAYVRQNAVWQSEFSLYSNCAQADPDSARAHEALAGALYGTGDKKAAQQEAFTALGEAPNDPRAYIMLSYFAQSDGNSDRAIYYLKQGADTVKPDDYTRFQLATLYLNLAFLYERHNPPELAEAEASFVKSVELWRRPVGLYYLAQFYMDHGRYDKAVAFFSETLKNAPPAFAPIHLKLARAYDGLGNSSAAKQEYLRYLQLDPDSKDRAELERRLSQM